jgi:hypothetical protein
LTGGLNSVEDWEGNPIQGNILKNEMQAKAD